MWSVRQADYVLAVYQGIVREVYQVADWFPGGTTFMQRDEDEEWVKGRYEFVGRIAKENQKARRMHSTPGFLSCMILAGFTYWLLFPHRSPAGVR